MTSYHEKQIVKFGTTLLETEDLDPVYCALTRVPVSRARLWRTVMAYWCFYHLGVATLLGAEKSEDDFWSGMYAAACNVSGQYPRGTERRHFRGGNAMHAWTALKDKTVEERIKWWFSTPKFSDIAARVQKSYGFGPWIAFKIADMGERVLGFPVDFTDCKLGFYREPRAGAALVLMGDASHRITDGALNDVVEWLIQQMRSNLPTCKAPPHYDRMVNVQEAETILCKYKSHVGGHYPPGKDTEELRHALADRRWGPLAAKMRSTLS